MDIKIGCSFVQANTLPTAVSTLPFIDGEVWKVSFLVPRNGEDYDGNKCDPICNLVSFLWTFGNIRVCLLCFLQIYKWKRCVAQLLLDSLRILYVLNWCGICSRAVVAKFQNQKVLCYRFSVSWICGAELPLQFFKTTNHVLSSFCWTAFLMISYLR